MRKTCVIRLFLMALVVSGCGSFPIETEAPAMEKTATTEQSQRTDIETTEEFVKTTPTIRVTPTPNPTDPPLPTEMAFDAALTYCNTGRVSIENGPQQLPLVDDLNWELEETAFGPVTKLSGATTAIWGIHETPNPRWLMVEFLDEGPAGGDDFALVDLYLIDQESDDHWVVSGTAATGFQSYAWMENARLLWVDNGELSIADVDGTNKINLAVPVPIDEIWLGAENIALARSEDRLWRVDVLSDTWQEVTGISPSRNLSIVNNGKAALSVSIVEDYTIAEYWYIPLEFGGLPKLAASGDFCCGHGGRAFAPYRIEPGPYWNAVYLEQETFIDERDGSAVSGEEAFPTPLAEAEDHVSSYSPDGQWAILETDGPGNHIAPVQDLHDVQFIEGKIIAWQSDPPAAFVLSYSEDKTTGEITSGSIHKHHLLESQVTTLLENFDINRLQQAAVIENHIYLTYFDSWDTMSFFVEAYSAEGISLGSLNFPKVSDWRWPYTTQLGSYQMLLKMTQVREDGSHPCQYMDTIWIWDAELTGK
jgi:hypothetical protein